MQEKYGKLYDAFDEHVGVISKEDNYEEWRNVRSFYEHFKNKFVDQVQLIRQNKRRKLDPIVEFMDPENN